MEIHNLVYTYDQLLSKNWSLDRIAATAFHVEEKQLGTIAYTKEHLIKIYKEPGSYCAILFQDEHLDNAIGHTACSVVTSKFGCKGSTN